MAKKLYVAYGSNLNKKQMQYRCPTAKYVGVGELQGYELQFKGRERSAFATIGRMDGASVPVGLWEIQARDERSLDMYEGFPSHYFKRDVQVKMGGREVSAMVYIMNPRMNFNLPSPSYYATVHQGYKDCGLDTAALEQALQSSTQRYYDSAVQYEQQSLFDYDEEEPEEDEDIEDEEEDEWEDVEDDEDEDEEYDFHFRM
ncbi:MULTISPECIES: gamma-glutamylcyclotransferase family protein [Eubacteriales]|uniref:gamma-glutamylcyclotransferase family protein n=1 Tax=Eubacteriales TaxID=186802 RepID=UPI0013696445|nr:MULTISPECIES: gamma-glutamylcyclotransferase family protein [Eubacteriales]NBI18825.1 gamma-glutamylcyclotransferase [Neglectibacter sp. 59]NBJ74477.1 gamma-glutamylcyclotransferase [Neglectibacter sp. X4]NCE82313.1 gamma-glutamylcyclotransferase [Neglectibacter sp. X58]